MSVNTQQQQESTRGCWRWLIGGLILLALLLGCCCLMPRERYRIQHRVPVRQQGR